MNNTAPFVVDGKIGEVGDGFLYEVGGVRGRDETAQKR